MAAIGPHRRYFCKTEKFSGRTPYANEIVIYQYWLFWYIGKLLLTFEMVI